MPGGTQPAAARAAEAAPGESWTGVVRSAALAVFVALAIFALLVQPLAGRIFWTVAIASLPLVVVLAGYHRWRQICPLAWFAQLAARLGRPGERRASPWLQSNYYYVAFAIFFLSLWMRLVAINGDGKILAAFLFLISLAALVLGAVYTGKTWCNYICPVSIVEKIYTEPRGLRETPNSQCGTCTACKPACPDINQENGYWKEIGSAPKRFVYFAFPGLVFSFYLYYYLQAGNWDYYFAGEWTDQPGLVLTAFGPGQDAKTAGFFFQPSEPRALAALLTLVLGALVSFGLFSLVERVLRERGVGMDQANARHLMFTIAAFMAFVTFYAFAGAPTLRLLVGVPHLFQILVVATATLFLVRRFTRRQRAFAEETLARQIIRRWQWSDVEPPKDLHDAFLIHSIRSQTLASGHARLLEIYKDAVREAVASGFLSRAEVQRVESLRDQLQISPAEHDKVMADLDEEERARILNPALQVSAEKRLQLGTYSRALESYLDQVAQAARAPDDSHIRHLRQEYAVTPEEHAAVLDDLVGKGRAVAPQVAEALWIIEGASHTLRLLRAARSAAGDFLADVLARKRARAVDGLMRAFGCAPDDEKNRPLRDHLLSDDKSLRETSVEALGGSVAQAIAVRLQDVRQEAASQAAERTTLTDSVRPHLASADPFVRVAALELLAERQDADRETLSALSGDEHELVRETALHWLARAGGPQAGGASTLAAVEKMIALRSIPLFSSLAPEDLLGLARACREREFSPAQALCVEGEPGDEVFALFSGEVTIFRKDAAGERMVGTEKAGGFIGEMAVLDPAPRAATVRAGAEGARVLCLQGEAFREVLGANPSVARGVISALASRLRGSEPRPRAADKNRSEVASSTPPEGKVPAR